ncbi:hypothetical protein [Desulfovibrio intestinalis]|uniref:Uncharacterized protein n=1 Tax=Desulfovibrio intestinalis TaxID=58621 RepID=A0A7W8BYY6_9BACT|nr:hypothetical protein [Desulfovibrio intestinalis]MBB5142525.1 hypothetical protein [Desulfovibrio intestinalis]
MDNLLTPLDYDKLEDLSTLAESIEDLVIGLREKMMGADGFSAQDYHAIFGGLALIAHAAHTIHRGIDKRLPEVPYGN